ncbi:hypothetical protein E3J61_00055 [Candidatus Dependentiae bacterium]|nr:MAG: hypothetical protein E3J61_00055 [Candidatus Dependentiae bacterium]
MHSYGEIEPALVRVPISTGELFDKITILEIKIRRVADAQKRDNVLNEWHELTDTLEQHISMNHELTQLKKELLFINEQLWDIEDSIRAKEAQHLFDEEFIELARSVYYTNEQRSVLKRKINILTGSTLIEEKEYTKY